MLMFGMPTMTLKKYLESTTQAAFATKLGVSAGLVSQWVTGETRITAEKAVAIQEATGGAVKARELRPDVFGRAA